LLAAEQLLSGQMFLPLYQSINHPNLRASGWLDKVPIMVNPLAFGLSMVFAFNIIDSFRGDK
jgi:hypothetical protein